MGKRKASAPVKKAASTTLAGKAFEPLPENDGDDDVSPKPSSGIGLVHLLMAVLCLAAGLLTPPFLERWSEQRSAVGVSDANEKDGSANASDGQDDRRTLLSTNDDGAQEDDEVVSDPASPASTPPPLPIHVPCTKANLAEFLHDLPSTGMHIACITRGVLKGAEEEAAETGSGEQKPPAQGIRLNYYHRMYEGYNTQAQLSEENESLDKLLGSMENAFQLPPPGPRQQPYALFSPRGELLVGKSDKLTSEEEAKTIQDLIQSEMVIIMEGGSWTWPGVRIGFTRTIELYSIMPGPPGTSYKPEENRTAQIETLSLKPLVVSVKGFIQPEECDHIQHQASPHMQYSGVSLMDKDKGRPASDWRTSQSTFLHATAQTPILYEIEQRTASLTRIPRQHQEDVQVLRYGHSEKYDAHHDFFNPALYQSSPGTLQLIENGRRNRQATVFWYLSDVEKGGETVFPREGGAPQPHDFTDCSKGLRVKPEKGKVIIFYDLLPNGQMDELSLHGGCPVEVGIKWAANKWVWNAPMNYVV